MANEARLELRHSTGNGDGWSVALNGTEVVGFFGPDARARAEVHRDELAALLNAEIAPTDPRDETER